MDEASNEVTLPREPIHRIVEPVVRFMHVEAASGLVLIACTVAALVLANSGMSESFLAFWKIKVGFNIGSFSMTHSLGHWINDGLMAVFFFVVGLEVKRELVLGELREPRKAILPVAAALGGMLVPAGIYLSLQWGQPAVRGWGIPMATDIAFVVGAMAILGPRIPHLLRVMVLSLAIVDDIGAIVVIAVGYTEELNTIALLIGLVGIAVVGIMARLGVRSFGVYTVFGTLVWIAFHQSGVHATIAGVVMGMMTPAGSYLDRSYFGSFLRTASDVVHGGEFETMTHRAGRLRTFIRTAREAISPLEYLEGRLHPWVAFLIMPVFALSNAGVPINLHAFGNPVAVAVAAGLFIGKPVGIFLFTWLAIKLLLKRLPEGLTWGSLIGASSLAGIGFTMALFIASLALKDESVSAAKIGVLSGSALSAIVGIGILLAVLPKKRGA
jgi:NhaA family Na+:H+ antiporter